MNTDLLASGDFGIPLVAVRLVMAATVVWLLAGLTAMALRRSSAALRHRIWALSVLSALGLPLIIGAIPEIRLGWIVNRVPSVHHIDQAASAARRSAAREGSAERQAENATRRITKVDEPVVKANADMTSYGPADDPRLPFGDSLAELETIANDAGPSCAAIPPLAADDLDSGKIHRSSVRWSLLLALPAVWGFWRFAWALAVARRLATTATSIEDALACRWFRTICRQFELSSAVRLRESSSTAIPLCIGWRKPCIVLPTDWRGWPEETLRTVLAHELAHVARGDVAWQLLARLACIGYWFHPLAWLAAWRMRVEREAACDDAVLAAGERPTVYARVLLNLASRMAASPHVPSVAVAMASRSGLEQRVRAILEEHHPRSPVGRFARRVLAAIALIVALVTGSLSPLAQEQRDTQGREKDSAEQPPPATATQNLSANSQTELFSTNAAEVSTEPRALVVEARELSTAAPVPDVRIVMDIGRMEKLEATTDAAGMARFDYRLPRTKSWRGFFLSAKHEGFVPLAARWIQEPSTPTPPDRLFFQMEKATTIGGRVLDQDDQPLADAGVVVRVRKQYPDSKQTVENSYEPVKTDASGRWSTATVPEQVESMEVGVYHHLCLTERAGIFTRNFTPPAALRDGSAIHRLQRGTLVSGTVLSPDGHPVADADVFYQDNLAYANSLPPVKTDAKGQFTLGIKPSIFTSLVAKRSGFGPAFQRLKVGTEPQRVSLTLQPAHTCSGRVVDPAGRPIAQAYVVASWNGGEKPQPGAPPPAVLHEQWFTAADGRFSWPTAPAEGIHIDVFADGFESKSGFSLTSDDEHEIAMSWPTTIGGAVVDAETGQAIPRFSLLLGTVNQPGQRFIWQRGMRMDEQAKKLLGSFEYTLMHPFHEWSVRVEAEGYLAEDSERFPYDGSHHALTFCLTKADPIKGVIHDPDGSPAGDSVVYLTSAEDEDMIEYLSLVNGDVREYDRQREIHAKAAADGSFELPPQKKNFLLVALSDTGFAIVQRRELRADGVIRLQKWARIAGTVTLAGKPAAGLELYSYDPDHPVPMAGEPRLHRVLHATTDADGHFEFPRAMPGRITLGHRVPNGVPGRIWFVALASLNVESGKSYDLQIGKRGSPMVGRLRLPQTNAWMVRKAEIVPQPARADRLFSTGVQVLEDGRFRTEDLLPGDYTLRISIHDPPPEKECGWGRILGEYTKAFTVPDGQTDSPIDLGSLEPEVTRSRPLAVGDQAPDFAVKTLDGRDLRLADYRGKFVLLDFWATWCAPCVAEMPNLLSVHERFAKDPRFALVAISLDDQPSRVAYFAKIAKLPWIQNVVGPDAPVVSAYGATAIPANFLIGPDGQIIAKDLRGDSIMTTLADALNP